MKYVLSLLGIIAICCGVFFCTKKNDEPLRIHIVANSTSFLDEQIKYDVKDAVVEYLQPLLKDSKNKSDAKKVVSDNLYKIKELVASTLKKAKVKYSASVKIEREKMPLRAYSNVTYKTGNYDSLKIELGSAQGDNWWCVVFPSVCFIN